MKATITPAFSRIALVVALLISLFGSAVSVTPVRAASIVVNSSADTISDDGKCTLREAIIAANFDTAGNGCISGSGADTISFADSYVITLGSQLPFITTAVTITGQGTPNMIVQAAASPGVATWRVFQVTPTGNLTLDQLIVRNGQCSGSCTAVGGIDPNSGGGIYNSGSLTVRNSIVSSNRAGYEGEGGGGIYNSGTLVITNSTISENSSYIAAAIYNKGTLTRTGSTVSKNGGGDGAGGIENAGGSVTVTNSSFLDNTSTAIFSWSGALHVTDSTFSGNSAYGQGAGIESDGSATVINSTFSDNSSYSYGGGISNGGDMVVENSTFVYNDAGTSTGGSDGWGGGIYNNGTLTVANSTFSNNYAFAHGGGISNHQPGKLTLKNSTLVGNTTQNDGGGIYNEATASTILRNTIVANSTGANCFGTITNEGNNLDSGTTCGWGTNSGSLSNTDPQLDGLADNGGPTQTIALLAGSPAINAGNDATCPSTDQRGIKRPQGLHCDIGAYEKAGPPLPGGWVGGVSVTSDQKIVSVGRPHIGPEVASYDGFAQGSLASYVPMLFRKAYGSYDSALYVQNVSGSQATITVKYYDSEGLLQCTKVDTIQPLASRGYWLPTETCTTGSLVDGFVGGAVVTSDQPVVAVGRPHIGSEVMTYDGFTGGSNTLYIPMLFKGAYGGSYNSAFYIQNVSGTRASITIGYYDSSGVLQCTKNDTINSLASKGYWVPTATCDSGAIPSGWVGGVIVTSNQPIVGIGRPHIGTQVTTYNGFTSGGASSYIPMLFKGAYDGSYNAAFYLQNTTSGLATIQIRYYSSTGALDCTKSDTINPLASKGYWLPSAVCDTGSLPAGWVGGVVVSSNQPVVGVGRPHIGAQVTTYNGFTAGSPSSFLPMLFKGAYGGSYNSAFYIQNTANNLATVTVKFYDTTGALSCTHTDTIPGLSTLGYWVPSILCDP